MKTLILSKNRAADISTHLLFPNAILCVPESQFELYKPTGCELIAQPDCNGLSKLRNWVVSVFGCPVLMLDDDISKLYNFSGDLTRECDMDEVAHAVEACCQMATDAGAGIFGFNQKDIRQFNPTNPFSLTGWVGGAIGVCNTGVKWDENLRCKCDIDACLRELMIRRIIWKDNRYGFVQKRDSNTGGNALNKTSEQVERELSYLQAKWGKHIKIDRDTYTTNISISINVSRKQSVKV